MVDLASVIPKGQFPDDHQHDSERSVHAARRPGRAEARAGAAELRRVPRRPARPAPVEEAPQVRGRVRGGEGPARRPRSLARDRREARQGGREDRGARQVRPARLRRADAAG